ncbi:MAG: hypothetical protein GQ477_01170 [Nanohaloarchaea archaeon]|nr:hypothetical protein [Candidatus Nanohaloarchaea archaeon]
MRKGYFSLDMVIGFVIFLMVFTTAVFYIGMILRPGSNADQINNAGAEFARLIEKDMSWTVYLVPVFMTSQNTTQKPIEIPFHPEDNTDINSIIMGYENQTEINSSFVNNTIIFNAKINKGQNNFYLIYTKDTNLEKRIYSTDLTSTATEVKNTVINTTLASTGITQINFNGTDFLQGIGINLTTDELPTIIAVPHRAEIKYASGITAKIYSNSSKIIITSNHTFSPTIYLKKTYSNYYNTTTNTITTSGLQFTGAIDLLDVYSTDGISIIGNNLDISLYNNTYIEIQLTDVTEFEIYLHNGDYTDALLEKDTYLNPPTTLLLIPETKTGINLGQLSTLNQTSYQDLKTQFSKGTDFSVNIYNYSLGIEAPTTTNVFGMKYPVSIIDRFAKVDNTTINILLW